MSKLINNKLKGEKADKGEDDKKCNLIWYND